MPNGSGGCDCGNCSHFAKDTGECLLRKVKIENPHWTTCRSFHLVGKKVRGIFYWSFVWLARLILRTPRSEPLGPGPVFAIVYDQGYCQVPYFDGQRVEPDGNGEIHFLDGNDGNGKAHKFASVADYLRFYKESGREE